MKTLWRVDRVQRSLRAQIGSRGRCEGLLGLLTLQNSSSSRKGLRKSDSMVRSWSLSRDPQNHWPGSRRTGRRRGS